VLLKERNEVKGEEGGRSEEVRRESRNEERMDFLRWIGV
jgi:hypothetical protein